MRKKPSKKTVVMTIVIVGFSIAFAGLITWLISDSGKKTKITPTAKVKEGAIKEEVPEVTDVQSAIEKDKEISKKEGQYLGIIDSLTQSKHQQQPSSPNVNDKDLNKLKGELSKDFKIEQEEDLRNKSALLSNNEIVQNTEEKRKMQLWGYFYAQNIESGGFAENTSFAKDNKTPVTTNASSQSQVEDKKNEMNLSQVVNYYKAYTAKIEIDITSTNTGVTTPFVAKITQQSKIKDWLVVGKVTPDYTLNRFSVIVDALVSPDQKRFPIKGFVTSIDNSAGIITEVKHYEIANMGIVSGLAASEEGVKSLSRDEEQQVVTNTTTGTVIVSQQKDPNRTREAIIAGVSKGLGEAKNIISKQIETKPMLILRKGTPVLVYFAL